MNDELNRVYEALQKADQAGNVEDAKQLASYARQLEGQSKAPKEAAPETKEKSVEAQLNDMMYPAAGAVAGGTVGGATTAGRIIGGLKDAAKGADPVAMEQARRIAEKNAVETWGRTQHRVPGMPTEKPGLYFGEPTYALEKQRAYNEIQKMSADPQYQAKVLAEQKPAVAQYAQRVAKENPTAMQKVGNFLGRSPMGAIAGGLTGLGAGFQASDAVNRYNEGDKLGSAISGVGAVGTGLSMIPHPVTRIGGTAVGLGAEGLNAYIDFLKKNNPFDRLIQQSQQPQQPQQQAQPQQQPQRMASGGRVKHFADGGPTAMPMLATSMYSPESMPSMQLSEMEPSFDRTVPMAYSMMEQPQMMADMGQPQMVSSMGQPRQQMSPFIRSQPAVNRAPMNPFNPGFAAKRPVMPAQPRPNIQPQAPQPRPMGGLTNFRSPLAQQRVAAGLSQLPRKPMFRRYDEGGSV
jgi:hypothetical protein